MAEFLTDTTAHADIICAAASYWGFEKDSARWVTTRENVVYRIQTEDGAAALRLHRLGYRNHAELMAELEWMAMLANNGMRVPPPIKSNSGQFFHVCEGVVVSVLRWLPGLPLSALNATPEHYFNQGILLAQMHNHADAWELPGHFERPQWVLTGETPTWGRFWENPALNEFEVDCLSEFHLNAHKLINEISDADYGLIHADLVPDNVLVHDDQLYCIDFDDGGFGHRLFDLATVTHRSRRNDASGNGAEACIAGYLSVRAIDLDRLSLFEALRACSYVGWNIERMNEDGAAKRNKRFITEAVSAINTYRLTLNA